MIYSSAPTTADFHKTAVVAAMLICLAVPSSDGQVLYSFESGLDGFEADPSGDSDYISHMQSTIGATDGAMSLEIETGPGWGFDVRVNENPTDGSAAYDLWNTVSSSPEKYTLDFDVTVPASSWSVLQDTGGWFDFAIRTSSDGGFVQTTGVLSPAIGADFSGTASIPVSSISTAVDSSYYQLVFGNNSAFTSGVNGEGLKYYIDNIRFTEIPQYDKELLFSWETPDDPGTPDVDERLEGWGDGFDGHVQHVLDISTDEGVTDGVAALSVEKTQSAFSWGSQFALSSGEEGDPANQPLIDEYIAKINAADKIVFDVTFKEDQFPNAATYLSLFLNISDQSGNFFQSPTLQVGNPTSQGGQTTTLEVEFSQFTAGDLNLADTGLVDGDYFRIALASNSDDGAKFAIDNLRLLTLVTEGIDGDYNDDGMVDAADYTLWRDSVGLPAGTLPNDPNADGGGTIGSDQYATWRTNYGLSAEDAALSSSAVPAPSALVALCVGVLSLGVTRRR